MGRTILRSMVTVLVFVFCMIALAQLSEAVRVVPDNYKGNLQETIKKEAVQKQIIKKQESKNSSDKENKPAQPDLKNTISSRPPAPEVQNQDTPGKTKGINFYIFGGLFFLGIIIIGVIFFLRKIEAQ
jgi:hypothetical protein